MAEATLSLPPGISDPYHEMGLPHDAQDSAISKAYKDLARRYHPDKQSGKSPDEQKKAEAKFMRVKAAYDFLNDENQKKLFDDIRKKEANALKRKAEREGSMDESRRELKRKLEEEERRARDATNRTATATPVKKEASSTDSIRKQNRARRDDLSRREERSAERPAADPSAIYVKIKCLRSTRSLTEALVLSLFEEGCVVSCKIIGDKNAALVEFSSPASASAAVQTHNSSTDFKITLVSSMPLSPSPVKKTASSLASERDKESVGEFNARRAAERERLSQSSADTDGRDGLFESPVSGSSAQLFAPLTADELLAEERRTFATFAPLVSLS